MRRHAWFFVAVVCIRCEAQTSIPITTPNIGLYLPAHGTYNWDSWYNANWTLLDSSLVSLSARGNLKCNGTADDTAAWNALLASAATGNGVLQISSACAGQTSVISSTLSIPSGVVLVGPPAGQNQMTTARHGITFKWAGPIGVPMLKLFDVNHSGIANFNVDCSSITNCIGIHYASDNAPESSYVFIAHVLVLNAHQAFVIGDPSNTAANCGSTPNALGCAQADSADIFDFNVVGPSGDTAAEGIHVNDTNGLQSSVIRMGNLQAVSIGIRMVASNGNLVIQHMNGANPTGAKTFIQYDSTLNVPPALIANETEGSWTYAVHDTATDASYQYASVWLNNSWNNPVLCDGNDHVLSLGNNGGNHSTIPWTAGGTCVVDSLLDNTENSTTMSAWVSIGSGVVNSMGALNSAGGAIIQGAFGATWNGVLASTGKGNITAASAANTGALFVGTDGACFISRSGTLTLNLNCGSGATVSVPGGSTLSVPSGTISTGSQAVVRCTTAGTLPVGALTINSANCGASINTGLSTQ